MCVCVGVTRSFVRTNTTVRSGGGDVFPPARLPAVLKCLPGGVRERQTGSAYAFVPGRERRNRRESVRHRSGCHVGVGHVRQPVRAQLQRFLTLHQRGLGSFLANGKNKCGCVFCVGGALMIVPARCLGEGKKKKENTCCVIDLSRKELRNVNALLYVGFLNISVAKYLCVIVRFYAVRGLVWLSLQMGKV